MRHGDTTLRTDQLDEGLGRLLLHSAIQPITTGPRGIGLLQIRLCVVADITVVGDKDAGSLSSKRLGCGRTDTVIGASNQDNLS